MPCAQAVRNGELRPQTPVEDVVRILRVTFMSCAPITQDSGSFDEVERLFAALRAPGDHGMGRLTAGRVTGRA